MRRLGEWWPTALAATALIGFTVVLALELVAYQRAVIGWAERDLQSRADLAAANLVEPLATQDFARLDGLARNFAAEGMGFEVRSRQGGLVFAGTVPKGESYRCRSECGEYVLALSLPASRVLAPFHRSLWALALAALAGMAAVVTFFLVTYRQRVRIRELARLEQFRREFIADVSHEIKTPLTGILGAVEMLGDEPPATMRTQLLGMLKKEANRLSGLVRSILELSRIERGRPAAEFAPVELAGLVRETTERLAPRFAAAGVNLTVQSAGEYVIEGEGAMLDRAMTNLLSNALAYSGADEVKVELAPLAHGGVELAVEDRGIGIPEDARSRIFERFYRVDKSRSAEGGGSGLGLAIVRGIARLHGGEALFTPVAPHGSRFSIRLPRGKLTGAGKDAR